MDKKASDHFAHIIKSVLNLLTQPEYDTDITPERAILHIRGQYGSCRVFITELLSDGLRKYRYYVLRGNRIEAGFDNAPDPRAIRMKYGKIGKEYAGEPVPHLHLENKNHMVLTEETPFSAFVEWLEQNAPKEDAK